MDEDLSNDELHVYQKILRTCGPYSLEAIVAIEKIDVPRLRCIADIYRFLYTALRVGTHQSVGRIDDPYTYHRDIDWIQQTKEFQTFCDATTAFRVLPPLSCNPVHRETYIRLTATYGTYSWEAHQYLEQNSDDKSFLQWARSKRVYDRLAHRENDAALQAVPPEDNTLFADDTRVIEAIREERKNKRE